MMMTGLIIIALVFLLPNGLIGLFRMRRTAPASLPSAALRRPDEAAASAPRKAGAPILRFAGVTRVFRGLRAIDGVDLVIEAGSITTIIGPNGAGKSTLFNMATGYLAPTSGGNLVTTSADRRNADLPSEPSRRRTHLPDRQAVPWPQRLRERAGRGAVRP